MIILTKGNVEQVYCTPLENADSVFSTFYFKFTNRITQSVVEYTSDNTSLFDRYQQFDINTNAFENENTGFWTYEIKQWDENNAEPVGPVLESGFMYLNPTDTFEPTKYDEQNNSFITYNG